jgi:hypothetical protein
MPLEIAKIEITPPKVFTTGAVIITYAHGLLLAVPVLISVVIISLIPMGFLTYLLPALAVGLTVLFLPLGLGNAYISRLATALNESAAGKLDGFIVQLALSPRIRSGLRALVEDADDIGSLSIIESELIYRGDSVRLTVPFSRITAVHFEHVGRGLFIYGSRMVVSVSGLPNVTALEFSERSSLWLPTSRKVADELRRRFDAIGPGRATD